jgi:hypothetical protein
LRMNCQHNVRAQPRLSYEIDAPSLTTKRPSFGHARTMSSHGLPFSFGRTKTRGLLCFSKSVDLRFLPVTTSQTRACPNFEKRHDVV